MGVKIQAQHFEGIPWRTSQLCMVQSLECCPLLGRVGLLQREAASAVSTEHVTPSVCVGYLKQRHGMSVLWDESDRRQGLQVTALRGRVVTGR